MPVEESEAALKGSTFLGEQHFTEVAEGLIAVSLAQNF